jgi:hypothetical protein
LTLPRKACYSTTYTTSPSRKSTTFLAIPLCPPIWKGKEMLYALLNGDTTVSLKETGLLPDDPVWAKYVEEPLQSSKAGAGCCLWFGKSHDDRILLLGTKYCH